MTGGNKGSNNSIAALLIWDHFLVILEDDGTGMIFYLVGCIGDHSYLSKIQEICE